MIPHGTEFILRAFSRRRFPVRYAIARAILEHGSGRGTPVVRISVDDLARYVYGSSSVANRRNVLQTVYLMRGEAIGFDVISEEGAFVALKLWDAAEGRRAV